MVFSCCMLVLVINDWFTDVREKIRMEQIVMDSEWEGMGSDLNYTWLILSNLLEPLFLACLVPVLVLGVPFLPTALSVLTVLLAGREMIVMTG